MSTLRSVPAKADGFTVRVIGEETILVNEQGDTLHTLNPTGSFILARVDGQTDVQGICGKLREEFDAPAGSVEADVMAFLDEMEGKGIIRFVQ